MSLLVDWQIIAGYTNGEIKISPFVKEHVGPNSYDVCLGSWFCREREVLSGPRIYNPLSKRSIRLRYKDPERASCARYLGLSQEEMDLHEVRPDSMVIPLYPGEFILAHTEEFIGGVKCIVPEMHARSTLGRSGVTVCMCAGWGDVGYINRWTMEMKNNSPDTIVLLPVGKRVAQISLVEVEQPDQLYHQKGHYQNTDNFEVLEQTWDPMSMFPNPL